MLFSQLGYYSLIFALTFSVILIPTVYKDLKIVNNVINPNILTVVFLQLFLVLLSFICLVISFFLILLHQIQN